MKDSILMLAENPIPASKRVSRPHYLAQTLAQCGFAVRTITFRSDETTPIPGCEHTYLPIHFKQFDIFTRISFFLSFFYVLREILKSRPALLHGQGFMPGLVIVLYARLFRAPCLVGLPDFVETLYESFKYPLVSVGSKFVVAVENFIARNVDALVVESELAKTEWIKRGVHPDKIYPIHHAADISLFDPYIKGEEVRATYALDGNILITYHGDIGSDDGVDILLRSFRAIAEKNPAVKLMIIGSGGAATMDELKKLSAGLEDRVIFTGWIPYREVPKYIAASDIGVAPFRSTLYTNTVVPTKVLEIMAMQKSAVVSSLTTFSQYVSHKQHCLLVEPDNVAALTTALLELIDNPKLRDTLGKNGHRLVKEKFTWDVKIREEVQVIENIIRC